MIKHNQLAKGPKLKRYMTKLKLYRGEWIVLVFSGHALFLSPLLWCHHCTTFWQENRPFPAKSVHCMYLCIALRGLLIKLFPFTIDSFEYFSRTILDNIYTIDTVFLYLEDVKYMSKILDICCNNLPLMYLNKEVHGSLNLGQ